MALNTALITALKTTLKTTIRNTSCGERARKEWNLYLTLSVHLRIQRWPRSAGARYMKNMTKSWHFVMKKLISCLRKIYAVLQNQHWRIVEPTIFTKH